MNIHFEDKEVFEELKRITLFKTKMGSWMYGTNDEYSDTDFLYIYMPSEDEILSMASSHHQFQYKENGVDHIFTDIFTFLKNSLNGDSTINFEIINHESLINSKLNFIYDMRLAFHNYKIIRSYLGLARRDLKYISKGIDIRDKNKKLNHVLRGYYFCVDILNSNFNPIINKESILYKELLYNKEIIESKERHVVGDKLKNLISITRDCVNKELDDGSLKFPQYMRNNDIKKLDLELKQKMVEWRSEFGTSNYFDKLEDIIYDAIANGIKYDEKQYIIS